MKKRRIPIVNEFVPIASKGARDKKNRCEEETCIQKINFLFGYLGLRGKRYMISIDKLSVYSPLESVKKESVYEIGNMPRLNHYLKKI